jgi:hypothetical protein
MDKITEALKSLIPSDQISEVNAALTEMISEAKEELEATYNKNLEEAYGELAKELKDAEATAYQGYQEAYGIINDLRNRLESQKVEFEKSLEEGYEEAYQMLLSERKKNENLEIEIYEEYDGKLAEMKSYIVEKVDQFLQTKGSEIYEQAKSDVLADPRLIEHKVVLDKIIDLTSTYGENAEVTFATSTKLEEARKSAEDLKAQLRIMEARNIRLSTENTKLNEQFRKSSALVSEARQVNADVKRAKVINEQKERIERSQKVSGRGHIDTTENVRVISEGKVNSNSGLSDEMLILSGVKNNSK